MPRTVTPDGTRAWHGPVVAWRSERHPVYPNWPRHRPRPHPREPAVRHLPEQRAARRIDAQRAGARRGETILSLNPSVSVVIRARDEARFIGQTLEAIFQPGALQPLQVVVVDSGSTDGTQAIVSGFPTTLLQIRAEDFTYGYALNLGVAAVDSDIVATLSAHSLPVDANWLRRLIEPFARPRVAGVYGRQRPRPNATLLELIGMRLTGVLSDTPRVLDRRPLFSNANGAFRRSLWLEHPFDEKVGGAEDIAWVRTMQERGFLIAYEPTAVVYHSHGEPIIRHLRRASRDVPTVVGNVLHLGSGGRLTPRSPKTEPVTRPAPD
ncbi:MAG TPA: glycosyltransferase [Chloroflexota bacterium]